MMGTIGSNPLFGSRVLGNTTSLFFRSVFDKNRIQKFDLGPSFLVLSTSKQNLQQDNRILFGANDYDINTTKFQHSLSNTSNLFFYNYLNLLHGMLSYLNEPNMSSHLFDQKTKTSQQVQNKQKTDTKNTRDSLVKSDEKRNFKSKESQVNEDIFLSDAKRYDLPQSILKKHVPSDTNTTFLHFLLPETGFSKTNDENRQQIKFSNASRRPSSDHSQDNSLASKSDTTKENFSFFQNSELASDILIKYLPFMHDESSINEIMAFDNDGIVSNSNPVQVMHDKLDEKAQQQEQTSNFYYDYPVNSFFSKLFATMPLFQLVKIFQKEKLHDDDYTAITSNDTIEKTQAYSLFISGSPQSFLENIVNPENKKRDNYLLSELPSDILKTYRGSQIIPQRLLNVIKLPGIDTSSIQIHTGNMSRALNQMYNSEAMTINNDIFFSDPSYLDFSSPRNLALLGHELVHITQMITAGRDPTQNDFSENNILTSPEHEELETEALEIEKTLFNYFTSSVFVPTETAHESQIQHNYDYSRDNFLNRSNLKRSSNLLTLANDTNHVNEWLSVLPIHPMFSYMYNVATDYLPMFFAMSSLQPLMASSSDIFYNYNQFLDGRQSLSRQQENKQQENNYGASPTVTMFYQDSLQSSSVVKNDSKQNKINAPMFAKKDRLDYDALQNQTVSSLSEILPSSTNSETNANMLAIDYAMIAETVYKLIIQKIKKRTREKRIQVMSSSKVDPYPSFRFAVEIDGIEEAGFSEVSGITIQTEVEEQKEGGVNNFVYKLPKQTKYDDIKLKRGMTNSTILYDWYIDVVKGKIKPKDIAIVLYDIKRDEVKRWTFQKAFPIKWTGSDLNATNNNLSFESLEFTHQGF